MATLTELHQELKSAAHPSERRELALALLDRGNSRQYVDDCLRVLGSTAVLGTLGDSHRPVLRRKCLVYFEDEKRDKAGILREGLTRLLAHIGHPDDEDIYRLGLETYHLQPVHDVAQNLRAAALAGLAPHDPRLAGLYAARFLGETHTSVFNCEPAMTAIDVLARSEQRLPIYQFLLRGGEEMAQSARGELTGKALESLGDDFPPDLYAQLIERYRAIDQPTASMGIINWVLEQRAESLYDQLEALIMETRDIDLRRYGLIMLATARDDDLSERLLRLARFAKLDDLPLFIDALELCQHPERDSTLESLRRRLRR